MSGERGPDTPRYSVVTPTYERCELVLSVVRAFARQENAPPFEVVVVVDGGHDGSAAALRALEAALPFGLRVVEQPNRGPGAARNRGVAEARGELLLFLDDDMEADPRLLAEHERFHDAGYDVVFGAIPLHEDSRPGFLSDAVGAWAKARAAGFGDQAVPLHELITGQMSLRRELFLTLGGFDERFARTNEDIDFGRRVTAAGYRVGYNPDAISRHIYVVTPAEYLDRWREAGRADVRLARKHAGTAETIFVPHRRERRSDRLLWRWLRYPLRRVVLRAAGGDRRGARLTHWFYRVRNLEYFAGIREQGGVPALNPVRVLCYHAIAEVEDAGSRRWSVPPDSFRRQLEQLTRRFHPISARELVGLLERGEGVPRRAVLLTFDDCTTDVLETAAPLLHELDVPALAFAVTQRLGGTNDWRGRRAGGLPLLDAEGLLELASLGIEIGAHTRRHVRLSRLGGEELADELRGCADDLEEIGLPRPDILAYPYGDHSPSVRAAAAQAGYRAALTVRAGLARHGGDRFSVPRIEIRHADGSVRFLWKVAIAGRLGSSDP